MFNLGNSLLMQQKAKEAMEQFESASKVEKDRDKLAQIYHNMGVILQSSKQYPQCIEAYKESYGITRKMMKLVITWLWRKSC